MQYLTLAYSLTRCVRRGDISTPASSTRGFWPFGSLWFLRPGFAKGLLNCFSQLWENVLEWAHAVLFAVNCGAAWPIVLVCGGDQIAPSRSMAQAVTNILRATAMIACFLRDLEPPRTRSYKALKCGLKRIAHQATSVSTERSNRGPRRLIRFWRSILPLCHFLEPASVRANFTCTLKTFSIVDMRNNHLRTDNANTWYRLDNLDTWIGLGDYLPIASQYAA